MILFSFAKRAVVSTCLNIDKSTPILQNLFRLDFVWFCKTCGLFNHTQRKYFIVDFSSRVMTKVSRLHRPSLSVVSVQASALSTWKWPFQRTIWSSSKCRNNERDLRDEEPGINRYTLFPILDGCFYASMLRGTTTLHTVTRKPCMASPRPKGIKYSAEDGYRISWSRIMKDVSIITSECSNPHSWNLETFY